MKTRLSRICPSRLLGLVMAAVLASAGCSGGGVKKVTVQGTISYRGQPVRSGILQFKGQDNSFSTGLIQADGTYTVADIIPGEVKVAVQEEPVSRGSSKGDSPGQQGPPVTLPERYYDPETSGLQYTITPQTKELRIEIEK